MALLYLLCHVLTPGTGRRQTQNAPLGWSAWRLAMASIFSKWWTLLVLFVVFVEGAAVLGTLTFIPTHIASQTSSNLSRASMVAAMFGAGGIIYSRAVYRLTPLIGTPSMTGIGAGLVALALLGVAICASTAMFAMFCLCAGIGFYMHHNTLQFCATLFSDKARGAGISLFVSTLFLGQAAGISGAAQVMAAYSLQHWIVISAIFMLLLGIIFPVALKRQLTEGNVI
jgi:YNFM family putative membrane transporter